MTDQPRPDLDELLKATARDYNAPGPAPKELMWERIQARREQARVVPLAPRRRWLGVAVAAALLLLGIGIGRLYERWGRADATPSVASASRQAANSASPATVTPESLTVAPLANPALASNERRGANGASTASRASDDRARTRAPDGAAAELTTRSDDAERRSEPSLAFQLAVVAHLAGTEAMLTSFRTAAKQGQVDAQITDWARKLLTTTRLLQTSAARQDPMLKRLLDDLELVLVQIAQYTSTGTHSVEELELIEHSIERRGVIGKLRTTIPARLTPAGT